MYEMFVLTTGRKILQARGYATQNITCIMTIPAIHMFLLEIKTPKIRTPSGNFLTFSSILSHQTFATLLKLNLEVWNFFLCSPNCPKQPRIENSYYKCGSRYLCLLLLWCKYARTYLPLPLRQWGAGNVYLLLLSS